MFDDFLLESGSFGGKFPNGLGRFLDLIGCMSHSGVVVSFLLLAFTHLSSVVFISILLLLLEVVNHISDEVSNILHWTLGFQLKSNSIKEISTKITLIDL